MVKLQFPTFPGVWPWMNECEVLCMLAMTYCACWFVMQFITTCEWEKSWKIGDNDREISSTINTRGYIACKKASRPCEGGLSSCCILWEMCRSLQCRATTTDAMGRWRIWIFKWPCLQCKLHCTVLQKALACDKLYISCLQVTFL